MHFQLSLTFVTCFSASLCLAASFPQSHVLWLLRLAEMRCAAFLWGYRENWHSGFLVVSEDGPLLLSDGVCSFPGGVGKVGAKHHTFFLLRA